MSLRDHFVGFAANGDNVGRFPIASRQHQLRDPVTTESEYGDECKAEKQTGNHRALTVELGFRFTSALDSQL